MVGWLLSCWSFGFCFLFALAPLTSVALRWTDQGTTARDAAASTAAMLSALFALWMVADVIGREPPPAEEAPSGTSRPAFG